MNIQQRNLDKGCTNLWQGKKRGRKKGEKKKNVITQKAFSHINVSQNKKKISSVFSSNVFIVFAILVYSNGSLFPSCSVQCKSL